jgi:hypothetical protein
MNLVKTKITNLSNKNWFSFESRQAFEKNSDSYNFKNGDLVIFHNSNIIWTIKN